MVEGREVDAYTKARLSDHTGFFAEIYIDGMCVNEKMLENNFAFKKPGLEQRGLKGRIQGPEGDSTNNNRSAVVIMQIVLNCYFVYQNMKCHVQQHA